ncbi:MAG: hypothetical protein QOK07_744 [Gemmatimonadaceae bacterium]|jgi:SAM-dependent methyltransferase|nr:hypothetical protein [Gemmatimonadaceae bacterium]
MPREESSPPAGYAAAQIWNLRHEAILEAGDRDCSEQWLHPFLPALFEASAEEVLDLGCGTGYDALDLAGRGFRVTGIDYSPVAIAEARRLAGAENLDIKLFVGDVARPLLCRNGLFDAVISNLVLHSFPETIVRNVVAEVWRCLRPGGLFLFHVNSTADLVRRTQHQPPERQLSADSFILAGGQTMYFFSEEYCRSLLHGWSLQELTHVASHDRHGKIVKSAWRCIAKKQP